MSADLANLARREQSEPVNSSQYVAYDDMRQPSSWSFQRANSDLVQKVQPNDKSGKLLRNNHTQGRKRAPGHLMSKGACGVSPNERKAPAVWLASHWEAIETTCIPKVYDLQVPLPRALRAPEKSLTDLP